MNDSTGPYATPVRRWRRRAILLLAYGGVTAVLVAPLIDYRHIASTCYEGDPLLIVWTLAWDSHALLHGIPLFDANVFYPAAHALAYNEHLFGIAIFYLPIYALSSNPILAYNLVWLAAWLLNALAAHALARRYVDDDLAAFVGGLVFAFSFFRMHHFAHLGLARTFWMPLALLAAERWYHRPSWAPAALLLGAVALQVLANWYLAVFVLVATGLFLLCLALFRERNVDDRRATSLRWWRSRAARKSIQLMAALAILCAIVWPFARHYRGLAADRREAASYSADLAGFYEPPVHTWPGRILARQSWGPPPRFIYGERIVFLGAIAFAFSAVGAASLLLPGARRRWPAIDRPARVFFPLLAFTAFALSLGPSMPGSTTPWWMPFDWLSRIPGVGGLRAPARFALLVLLAMSVLSAVGVASLRRRFGLPGRIATVLLIPLMLSEWYMVDWPRPAPRPIPKVYRYLATVPARAVVSLPIHSGVEWYRELDYLYYSTAHWHPIVNGGGRAQPDDHYWIAGHMMAFAGPNSARTMRRLGIDYVVVHADRGAAAAGMVGEALGTDEARANFRLEARDGNDYLFRVLPR